MAERSARPPDGDRPAKARRVARAEREAMMLRAAGQVFARDGYHNASMTEIAERGGVSKPMVYRYFGSKEAVYAAYVRASGQQLLDRIAESARATRGGTRDRLAVGIDAFLIFVEERSEGWGVLFGELATPGSALHADVSRIRATLVEGMAQLLEHDRAGDSDGNAEGHAVAIAGATESLANWWLADGTTSRQSVVDLILEVVWRGLEPT